MHNAALILLFAFFAVAIFAQPVPLPVISTNRVTIVTNANGTRTLSKGTNSFTLPAVTNSSAPFRGGVVWYAFPTPFYRCLLQTSTDLVNWQDVTNSPLDGKLRTNYPPLVPRRFCRLVYFTVISNNAGLTNR